VLLLLSLLLTAPAARAERLPVKIYTSADGLGSSASFSLVRDALGFIWLCSRDGLIRFDGYRFITYRIGDDDADPTVFNLLPTRQGSYWIDLNRGTDYRFVAKRDAALLAPVAQQPAKNDPRVPLSVEPVTDRLMPRFEDDAGNLWGADSKGIYLMREADGRLEYQAIELGLPGNPEEGLASAAFHGGRDGSLWVGTHWGLVRRLPDGRQIHFSLRPQNNRDPALTLAEDKEGRVWIARPEGLLVLNAGPLSESADADKFSSRAVVVRQGGVDPGGHARLSAQTGEATSFSFADILRRDSEGAGGEAVKPEIFGIICASDGRIWITSNRGLVVFDGERFQQFTHEQGLGQAPPASLVEDNQGNIWLTSYSGLMRLNPKGLTTYDQADGLPQARVHSIYEDRDGELNVVTDDWNVSRLHDGSFVSGRPGLPPDAIAQWNSNHAYLDSRGGWWVVTRQRVYRYTNVRRAEELTRSRPAAVYSSADGLVSDVNYSIFEDARGDIWISTFPDSKPLGLTRWQRSTGKFERFYAKDGLPEAAAASASATDSAGNLWFGFANAGLARFRDGRFTHFGEKDGAPHGLISDIHTDKAGRLWIASSRDGLIRVDDPGAERPAFRRYTIADGLTSNNVRCITEDLFGNIYVGTVRGVNRLSPETGRVKYYGTGDGLASDFVSVAYRDRNGALWFGTYSGLSKLIPEPDPPSQPPPILISGLRIAGVDYSVSPLGQLEVFVPEQSANKNNVQIDFFSITTGGDADVRYEFKLEGAGGDWSQPTAERSVTFANLSSGAYRFLVRAVNADGAVSAIAATVSFTILRPLWQRWWFLTLAAIALTGIVYTTYRDRVRRLIELERVRTRIATDLHDDIGASLSRMAILSEVVKHQTGGNGNESSGLLTEIADSARGLVDSMSDIVWSIDPRRDDLQSVVRRIRQFASDVLEAQGIDWELRVPPEVESLKLGPDERRHLFLIFKEGINNVARHGAGAKAVSLSIAVRGRQLIGEIKDDGCGFTPQGPSAERSKGRGGNGLPNMSTRAEQLGGRLEIASSPGSGTRLTLRVPLK
jgi:ligand-binding sensor domain-containing protein/signal transduction histidine kinase